jgi:ATP-binding cassette subfamily F protein 3
MFSVQNILVQFGGTPLFRSASFIINTRDRIGLVGKNGSGKTTLLRVIAGLIRPDEGEAIIPNGKTIGFLPQEIELRNDKSVLDEASSAFSEINHLETQISSLNEEITSRQDYHSRQYLALLHQLTELNDKFDILGGSTIRENVEKVLTGLGFRREEFSRPLNEFSYGWQMRVEIAKILLRRPDLLLLDEPTNHLDIESIQWLEEFLSNYPGAVIIVSHDRAFLDNVTNRTVEIELGKIYDYKASYSAYTEMREARLESQMAAFSNQQRQIRQIERFIERFRYKNTKARQVQSRIRMLEKMESLEIDELDRSAIHFRFPAAQPSGKVVAEAKGLTKQFGAKLVLDKIDMTILKGDRVAFVGRNGEGKTTLSRILSGKQDHEGELRKGYNVITAYYAQNPAEMLDAELTVFDTIDKVATGEIRSKIKTLLGGFLFSGDEIDKKVKVLSGGEKARLALTRLLLTPANFLVLDEPTNHLDMQSKDILKSALIQFKGTLVVVSHDRDFLQGLTNKVFEFRNRAIREYLGDIYDFLETRKVNSLMELEQKGPSSGNDKAEGETSGSKAYYEARKQAEKELRRLSGRIGKCEEEIAELETRLEKINGILADPGAVSSNSEREEAYISFSRVKKDLDAKWDELARLTREMEALTGAGS